MIKIKEVFLTIKDEEIRLVVDLSDNTIKIYFGNPCSDDRTTAWIKFTSYDDFINNRKKDFCSTGYLYTYFLNNENCLMEKENDNTETVEIFNFGDEATVNIFFKLIENLIKNVRV